MIESGVVKFWSEERGFGFIVPDRGGHDVFAHVSRGNGTPRQGDRIEFESQPGDRSPVAKWWRLLS